MSIRTPGLRKELFLGTALAAALVPAFAVHAQTSSTTTTTTTTVPATPIASAPTTTPSDSSADVVVTGSRIRQSTFNSPNPVQIINKDTIRAEGDRTITDLLQNASVTSGTAQINNAFLGYVTSGGPGSNTVGLRGLGADRTLVLLNGRRLAPAGSESEVGSADLNVLPTAVVDHVEVLKDGASSVYGSDAIAGVVNIITDTKFNGLDLEANGNMPLHMGGGQSYRLSGIWGKTFDRGHILLSGEYDSQVALKRADRASSRCPTDDLVDPQTGAFVGSLQGDQPRCLPFSYAGGQGIAQDYIVTYNLNGGVNRFTPTGTNAGTFPGYQNVDNVADRPGASGLQQNEDIYSPVHKLTFYGEGSYNLEGLNGAELYAEVLFSRRTSKQTGTAQLAPAYAGYYPGYYNYQLFPKTLSDAGYYFAEPLFILGNTVSKQRVNFIRADGGLRGDLGIKNWHYDANFMYSRNWSSYSIQNPITSHVQESFDLVNAPAGTPADQIVTAGADRVEPGSYTCAVNVSTPGTGCVPIDAFSASLLQGNVPQALRDWLLTTETGHTTYTQMTGEAYVTGDLFKLPAGQVQFTLGASLRHDHLNDVPSEAAQNADLFNYSSASITKGSDLVTELFGELSIPLLKDKPFFQDLSMIASGRYTHYRSIGSDETYKVSGNWTPAEFIRFRGSYGTSFRAPSLYQLNVADQTGFYGQEYDPCNDYQNQVLPSSNRYKNCLAVLTPIVGTGNFNPNAGPEAISQGGKGLLKAETSNSLNYGTVITPFRRLGLSLSADYFRIVVKNEVTQLSTDILNFCYDSPDFTTNFYCGLIAPRDSRTGNLTSFRDPFINVAKQTVDGIDFAARFTHDVGPGRFALNVEATRVLHQKYQEIAGGPVTDYNGTLGNADFAGGPKWTGDANVDYKFGILELFYRLQYVGPMDSNAFEGVDPTVDPYDFRTGKYFMHTVSATITAPQHLELTIGVTNLTDVKPKTVSVGASVPRTGNYFDYSGYDFLGRSVFMTINKKF